MNLNYRNESIDDKLINECDELSKNGDRFFIFDKELTNFIEEKVSVISESDIFHIGKFDCFNVFPSRFSYYDTETKSTDRYERYKIVTDFIKRNGFEPSMFNFGPEYEETFSLVCNEDRFTIRLRPNLIINISYDGPEFIIGSIYNGFFSKLDIINNISKYAGLDTIRDLKISSLIDCIIKKP